MTTIWHALIRQDVRKGRFLAYATDGQIVLIDAPDSRLSPIGVAEEDIPAGTFIMWRPDDRTGWIAGRRVIAGVVSESKPYYTYKKSDVFAYPDAAAIIRSIRRCMYDYERVTGMKPTHIAIGRAALQTLRMERQCIAIQSAREETIYGMTLVRADHPTLIMVGQAGDLGE